MKTCIKIIIKNQFLKNFYKYEIIVKKIEMLYKEKIIFNTHKRIFSLKVFCEIIENFHRKFNDSMEKLTIKIL